MYKNGYGVEKNYPEAVKWYRKSADQGNAAARNNLGLMYYRGQGMETNYTEAFNLFRISADQGYASAQYNLASMYENGIGVGKSYDEAYKWYKKAADNGHENARKWIAEQSSANTAALTVTGKVVDDETGDGLIGVSVIIAGAKTGTMTDMDGNFTLKNVPDGATLSVSYVGYSPQSIKVTSKSASGLLIKMK